jgi:hypothetical protein
MARIQFRREAGWVEATGVTVAIHIDPHPDRAYRLQQNA